MNFICRFTVGDSSILKDRTVCLKFPRYCLNFRNQEVSRGQWIDIQFWDFCNLEELIDKDGM